MNFSKTNHYLKKNNRNFGINALNVKCPKAALVLLLLSVTLNNCSSDDDSTSSEQSDYYLTAKVDGVDFSREFVLVSALADDTDIYIISAVGESSIGLTLDRPISTGTFTPTLGGATVLFYQETNPFVIWGATEDEGTGTITITENTDTYVKGTFSFTGVNPLDNSTKEITEGDFKAQKQ